MFTLLERAYSVLKLEFFLIPNLLLSLTLCTVAAGGTVTRIDD